MLLPDGNTLQKIAKSEGLLSRQMQQALYQLQGLQVNRSEKNQETSEVLDGELASGFVPLRVEVVNSPEPTKLQGT